MVLMGGGIRLGNVHSRGTARHMHRLETIHQGYLISTVVSRKTEPGQNSFSFILLSRCATSNIREISRSYWKGASWGLLLNLSRQRSAAVRNWVGRRGGAVR